MELLQVSKTFQEYEQKSSNPDARRKINNKHFKEMIWPLRKNWYFISYDDAINLYVARLKEAEELIAGMMEDKPREENYKEDGNDLLKRLETGEKSESIVAGLYKAKFDFSRGKSKDYHKLDIDDTFGVKSSEYGHCAMVETEPIGPQLIVVKDEKGKYGSPPGFYLCGLATVATQLRYATIHRLTRLSANWKKSSKKMGFYGYTKLIPVHKHLTISKMRELIMQYEDRHWWGWLEENKES